MDAYILLVNLGSVVGWLLLECIVRARNIFAHVLVRTLQTEHTTDETGFYGLYSDKDMRRRHTKDG